MNWDDYEAIGQALAAQFPDANYLTIKDADLILLVRSLPGFSGQATPDPQAIAAISYAWIAAVEGPDDSSPFENIA
ncbi:MAG TPA: Fe-S assembly protein IscX [Rhodospirillaceae bacterium]|nr:Fe-S assembly protein IscX [Rhodospirillaceae bacterium]